MYFFLRRFGDEVNPDDFLSVQGHFTKPACFVGETRTPGGNPFTSKSSRGRMPEAPHQIMSPENQRILSNHLLKLITTHTVQVECFSPQEAAFLLDSDLFFQPSL